MDWTKQTEQTSFPCNKGTFLDPQRNEATKRTGKYKDGSVEKLLDEMSVGVKGQSNLEIARTPRNAFRCSLGNYYCEVERLIRCEGFTAYQVLINSECAVVRSQE